MRNTTRPLVFVMGALFAAMACSGENEAPTASEPSPSDRLSISGGDSKIKYLPYGVPVPDSLDLNVWRPEPYDRDKHGPPGRMKAKRDSIWLTDGDRTAIALSKAGDRLRQALQRRRSGGSLSSAELPSGDPPDPPDEDPQLHIHEYGAYSLDYSGMVGLGAYDDVQWNVNLPLIGESDGLIFAPTHKPYNSCIEIGILHDVPKGWVSTAHIYFVYDHCTPVPSPRYGYEVYKLTDSSEFRNKYVRFINGEDRVLHVVDLGPYGWDALIYNWSTGEWDASILSLNGTDSGAWTAWESVNLMDDNFCEIIPSIQSVEILVRNQSALWSEFSETVTWQYDVNGHCWETSQYIMFHAEDGWKAATP